MSRTEWSAVYRHTETGILVRVLSVDNIQVHTTAGGQSVETRTASRLVTDCGQECLPVDGDIDRIRLYTELGEVRELVRTPNL